MAALGRLAIASAVVLVATSAASVPASAGPHPAGVSVDRFQRTERTVASGQFTKIYDPGVGESSPWYINDHTVVRGADGTWHLFGITHAEPADAEDEDSFAHATAPTLHGPWTKQPPALTTDPAYGETHLWAPHVIADGGTYYMFYAGGGDDPARHEINLVTSTDLYHWTRSPGGPLFRDGVAARDPMVLKVGDRWVMYYCATDDPSGGHHIVAYRTSTDLVHWSDRHIAFTSPDTGTGGGNTESPFVVAHDGGYDLFIGPCGGYAGGQNTYTCTDVFRSSNPFHFDKADHVGRIGAHAAEVVRDTDGRWYVTHAGWGQGGVYLAPLDWNGRQRQSGVRVRTAAYQAEVLTSPTTELTSLRRVDGDTVSANLLDTAFRGTTPYLGVGGFGDSDRPGPARVVAVGRDGAVTLRGIRLGNQPVTVDWTLDFAPAWFDTSLRWHVNAPTSAPVYEAGLSIDTTLPHLGDDSGLDRGTGDVFGFPRWTMATGDSVTLVAAYRTHSAWQEYNHWFNPGVGTVAWQSIQSGVGFTWSPGTYPGGTWRIGLSGRARDAAYADSLYSAVNG